MAEVSAEIKEGQPGIYDYIAYSQVGKAYDFVRLRGMTGPNLPESRGFTLKPLPKNTLLEVQSPLGPTFYQALPEGLGSKIIESQFRQSKIKTENPPFFVKLLTAEEKRNLESRGQKTVRVADLLPEEMPLPKAA